MTKFDVSENMRIINIKRKKENFNKNLNYKILVDDKEVARLKNGEEKTIEIEENACFIEAKIDSGLSNKIPLKKLDSYKTLEISGNPFRNKYLKYAGALIPLISLTFILKHNFHFIKIIGGILFVVYLLFIIFILIFQNRKWLNLRLIN